MKKRTKIILLALVLTPLFFVGRIYFSISDQYVSGTQSVASLVRGESCFCCYRQHRYFDKYKAVVAFGHETSGPCQDKLKEIKFNQVGIFIGEKFMTFPVEQVKFIKGNPKWHNEIFDRLWYKYIGNEYRKMPDVPALKELALKRLAMKKE